MAYNNPPSQLSIDKMLGALNAGDSVTKGCRFIVRINPGPLMSQLSYINNLGDLIYVSDGAEFPGRGFSVIESRYYGPRQLTPGNTIYGDGTNISFICRSKTLERQFFDDWMDIINPSNTYHFSYPNDYYATIDIFHYAEFAEGTTPPLQDSNFSGGIFDYLKLINSSTAKSPKVIYGWKLIKAWPTLVQPQQVTWADSDILRLNVTFAYKKWERPGDSENIAKKLTGRGQGQIDV
ncbi:hypothetical protein EB001_15240 [bacterium]|nr:hypothetical protein [bacterium]